MIKSIAIALVASFIIVPPAFANTGETQTRRVKVADLNLTSASDRAILERRIRSAARRVCESTRSFASPFASNNDKQCIAQAIAETQPRVALLIAAARSDVAILDERPVR